MRIIFLIILIALTACTSQQGQQTATAEKPTEEKKTHKRPLAFEKGKFFDNGGKRMLFGGKDSNQHFDISDLELKETQFHYGIGRERFPALLKPSFISIAEADSSWADSTRFLVAHAGDEVKAYSVKDLTRHEVVNDSLDGKPIMAAYCILADLGAIYERQYGDKELTFALSGYTYYDEEVWDGLDGFVFWDRETESLWWPLIGRAVSGPLKGVQLQEMDKAHWEDTDWKSVKENYPTAVVMKSGQDFDRPKAWRKYEEVGDIVEKFSQK